MCVQTYNTHCMNTKHVHRNAHTHTNYNTHEYLIHMYTTYSWNALMDKTNMVGVFRYIGFSCIQIHWTAHQTLSVQHVILVEHVLLV